MSNTAVQVANQGAAAVTGACVQASTASTVAVTGSDLDCTQYRTVAYTISVITNSIDWSVFGANVSDFSDEKAVQAATTVAAAAVGTYSASPAPFRYYRAKVIDTSGGSHGTATVNGIAKA